MEKEQTNQFKGKVLNDINIDLEDLMNSHEELNEDHKLSTTSNKLQL